jgi:hypothetical protein
MIDILRYVNLIRTQLGERELGSSELYDLGSEEIEKYLGSLGKEKYLREKYIECEGFREIHPVLLDGREGLLLGKAVQSYTLVNRLKMYMVLVGDGYEIKITTGQDCEKRIEKDNREIERYKEFKKENERLIRKNIYRHPVGNKMELWGEEYKYLGIYSPFVGEIKKVVLEKKESREVMYYNAVDIYERDKK